MPNIMPAKITQKGRDNKDGLTYRVTENLWLERSSIRALKTSKCTRDDRSSSLECVSISCIDIPYYEVL